jgi:hypothetical protein
LVETPNKTIPQFPVKDGASWDGIHAARWETEVKQSLRKVLPILYGTSEEIPENVRLYLREEWKKERGRRAIMDGVDNFPKLKTAPTEAWRADWDWTKSARENRHEDIRREVHPSPDENTKATPDVSAKMFEVLKEAQRHKRWGPKAIMAFKYYLKGATEEEAARRAGITDRTFRNNI